MSISSISSFLSSVPAQVQTEAQTRIDLQTLKRDLQAGKMTNAQQDFATLLKDSPNLQTELQTNPGTPQAGALTSLSSALQAGNANAAQTAVSMLQATLRDSRHPFYAQTLSATAPAAASKPSISLTL
jgi:hypothetical protein